MRTATFIFARGTRVMDRDGEEHWGQGRGGAADREGLVDRPDKGLLSLLEEEGLAMPFLEHPR